MLGLVGLFVSLSALMYFAYRGVNVLVLAPVCALIAVMFQPDLMGSGNQGILLTEYTQVFMNSMGKYVIQYFPVFVLGAIFGKLMDDTKAAKVIGEWISNKLGPKHAILATVLACSILTYGGVSLFVVAFCVYPIAVTLYDAANIHRRYIPGAIALGSFTFTMTALPGTPAIQNAIPMPYFGTTSFAAPILGIISGIFMLVLGMWWMNYNSKKTPAEILTGEIEEETHSKPSFALAITPLLIVIAGNFLFSEVLIPRWNTTYVVETFGIKIDNVKGLWAIIASLVIAIGFTLVFLRKYADNMLNSLNEGTMGSMLPIFNTASEVGYGAVIAGLASFTVLKDMVLNISPSNPLISEAVVFNLLAGITGSASGGMSIGLEILGEHYMTTAAALNISPELLHRVAALSSGGFDSLPHNGAVISLLTICKLTHKDSYKDIFWVTVLLPIFPTVLVIILGTMFGSF